MNKHCAQVAERIGANIRRLRKEKFPGHGSLKTFAEAIGIPAGVIGHYESGRRQPSEARMKQFADFFGVNISTLRGDGDCLDEEIAWRDRKIASLQQENANLRESNMELENRIRRVKEAAK